MSLVAVECCVEIMNNYIFVLSSLFLVGCLGLALKPSPIYGGLGLIVSGFVGCLMVLGFGGSEFRPEQSRSVSIYLRFLPVRKDKRNRATLQISALNLIYE